MCPPPPGLDFAVICSLELRDIPGYKRPTNLLCSFPNPSPKIGTSAKFMKWAVITADLVPSAHKTMSQGELGYRDESIGYGWMLTLSVCPGYWSTSILLQVSNKALQMISRAWGKTHDFDGKGATCTGLMPGPPRVFA